ncbi:hypothetical protein A2384_02145 [Candidatus Peribacteria bacterium RIFOXYB1_FULL_54_35]|nr:MAG: hypothetical protein A2384_02145 [Candidatus Peribacteria bacterium RIFOXYB1_FULL_54_35]
MGMWVAKLFSGSKSVENEVLRRLPEKIKFEFRAEFDNDNQLVIFAAAPEHEGLFSEGKDFDETINNCCDAVLTYFDVPREYAKLVEYECVGEDQQSSMPEELEKESWLKRVVLNKHLACA